MFFEETQGSEKIVQMLYYQSGFVIQRALSRIATAYPIVGYEIETKEKRYIFGDKRTWQRSLLELRRKSIDYDSYTVHNVQIGRVSAIKRVTHDRAYFEGAC